MNRLLTPQRLLLLSAVASATQALGQYTSANRDVLTPNTGTAPVGGVTIGGTSFINLGLQGVGRIAANSIDPATGETLGSISDMQITGWTRNQDGSYAGSFSFLPDRGYNAGATFSNYGARINEFGFNFTPYTSSAVTPLQNQIALTFTGSTRFTYDHDANVGTAPIPTTGLLATGVGSFAGQSIPVVTANTTFGGVTVANRLTVDAEGLAFDTRAGKSGTGWIGDEYGASLYHFNASKQLDGVIAVPAALVPHSPVGTVNYNASPEVNGRRINQGFEGVATSPDGSKLFTLLQSATIQDSAAGNQGRSNTRLLVYDISVTDTPTSPSQQYVIQLPRIDDNGGTPAVNRTGAQSSVLALNDHQLLILSRDGNGRGSSGSPVFKSILLADLSGATDIHGSFDAEGNPVAPGGVLNAAVTPISWTEALNMLGKVDLSVTELEQFGFNLNTAPGDLNTLSEKWEALSLVPANDPAAPNDFFLFVGNDNDFLTANVKMFDAAGTLQTYPGGPVENDTVVLAYRVTIAPVPEASTWGAGAAVLALTVGGTWLRRRARQ